VLLLLALGSCSVEELARFVTPWDGQAAVPLDEPLVVRLPELDFPPDEPVPTDLVQVVDLEDGGFVAGTLTRAGRDVVFRPDAPWSPERAYAWTVARPVARARQPVFEVADEVLGEAIFTTAPIVALLDAALDDGRLCLLFGTAPDPLLDLTVGDEVHPAVGWESWDLGSDLFDGLDEAHPATAACLSQEVAAEVGQAVRFTDADGASSQVIVRSDSLVDALAQRHRWSLP
jgi:hypothetical protein